MPWVDAGSPSEGSSAIACCPWRQKALQGISLCFRQGIWITKCSLRLARTSFETILPKSAFLCLTLMGALWLQELQCLILGKDTLSGSVAIG